jgi:hypothetical protein
MNLEAIQGLHAQLIKSWPLLAASLMLGWLFVGMTSSWLTKAWLRWPSAALVAAIAWIPYQNAPIGAAVSPISIQLGRERLFPASVWSLLLLLSIAIGLDLFAISPWRVLQWGYLADASRMGQTVLATVLSLLILLIALRRPILAALCLLPALFWRFGLTPSPNLWETYLDAPLAIAALIGLLSHFKSSIRPSHE